MKCKLIGMCGLVLVGSGALAGPLNKAVVAKGAQWVFHLDAEAGMASTIGRYITDHRAELDLEELDRVQKEIGIDPLKDIRGVTVYGTGPEECDGVAVIYASAALDDLVSKMKDQKKDGLSQIDVEGYTVYSWMEDGTARFAHVRPDGAGRMVIAAADKDHLVAGIRVVEGKAESLQKEGLGAASPRAGSILFASATHLPEAEALPFKHAEGFTFDAGEADQQMYADLRVTAKSTEEATSMSQVAMGAMAMARMALGNDPEYREALRLLNGVSVVCDEKDVVGKFRIPSDQIGAALSAINEQERPHHGTKPKKGSKKHDDGDKD